MLVIKALKLHHKEFEDNLKLEVKKKIKNMGILMIKGKESNK